MDEQSRYLKDVFSRFSRGEGDIKELESVLLTFRSSNNWQICLTILSEPFSPSSLGIQQFCAICLGECVRLHWTSLGGDDRGAIRSFLWNFLNKPSTENISIPTTLFNLAVKIYVDCTKIDYPELDPSSFTNIASLIGKTCPSFLNQQHESFQDIGNALLNPQPIFTAFSIFSTFLNEIGNKKNNSLSSDKRQWFENSLLRGDQLPHYFDLQSPEDPSTGAMSPHVSLILSALDVIRGSLRLAVPLIQYNLPIANAVFAALPFATLIYPSELKYIPSLPNCPSSSPQPTTIEDLLLGSRNDRACAISQRTLELVAELTRNTTADSLFSTFVVPLLEFAKQYANILCDGFFSPFFFTIGQFCDLQIRIEGQDPNIVNCIITQFLPSLITLAAEFCGHLTPLSPSIFISPETPLTSSTPGYLPNSQIANTFSPTCYEKTMECLDSILVNLTDSKSYLTASTSKNHTSVMGIMNHFAAVLVPLTQNSLTAPTFLANPSVTSYLINNHFNDDPTDTELSLLRLQPLYLSPTAGLSASSSLPSKISSILPKAANVTVHDSIFHGTDTSNSNWTLFYDKSAQSLYPCLQLSPHAFFELISSSILELLRTTGQKLTELQALPQQSQSPFSLPFYLLLQEDKTPMVNFFSTICDASYGFILVQSLTNALLPLIAGVTQLDFVADLPPQIKSPFGSPAELAHAATEFHTQLIEITAMFSQIFGSIASALLGDLMKGAMPFPLTGNSSSLTPIRILSTFIEATCQCLSSQAVLLSTLITTRAHRLNEHGGDSMDLAKAVQNAIELSVSFMTLSNSLHSFVSQAQSTQPETAELALFTSHLFSPLFTHSTNLLSVLVSYHRVPFLTNLPSFSSFVEPLLLSLFSIQSASFNPQLHPLFPHRHTIFALSISSLIIPPRYAIFNPNPLSPQQSVASLCRLCPPAFLSFDVLSIFLPSSSLPQLDEASAPHLAQIRQLCEQQNTQHNALSSYFSQHFTQQAPPLDQFVESPLTDSLALLSLLSALYFGPSSDARPLAFKEIIVPRLGPLCSLFSLVFAQPAFFSALPALPIALATAISNTLNTFGGLIGGDGLTQFLLVITNSIGIGENGASDASVALIQNSLKTDARTVPAITTLLLTSLDSSSVFRHKSFHPALPTLLASALSLTCIVLNTVIQARREQFFNPSIQIPNWLTTSSTTIEDIITNTRALSITHFANCPQSAQESIVLTLLNILNPVAQISIHAIPPNLSAQRPYPDELFTQDQLNRPALFNPPSQTISSEITQFFLDCRFLHGLFTLPFAIANNHQLTRYTLSVYLSLLLIDGYSSIHKDVLYLIRNILHSFVDATQGDISKEHVIQLWLQEIIPWVLVATGDGPFLDQYSQGLNVGGSSGYMLDSLDGGTFDPTLNRLVIDVRTARMKRLGQKSESANSGQAGSSYSNNLSSLVDYLIEMFSSSDTQLVDCQQSGIQSFVQAALERKPSFSHKQFLNDWTENCHSDIDSSLTTSPQYLQVAIIIKSAISFHQNPKKPTLKVPAAKPTIDKSSSVLTKSDDADDSQPKPEPKAFGGLSISAKAKSLNISFGNQPMGGLGGLGRNRPMSMVVPKSSFDFSKMQASEPSTELPIDDVIVPETVQEKKLPSKTRRPVVRKETKTQTQVKLANTISLPPREPTPPDLPPPPPGDDIDDLPPPPPTDSPPTEADTQKPSQHIHSTPSHQFTPLKLPARHPPSFNSSQTTISSTEKLPEMDDDDFEIIDAIDSQQTNAPPLPSRKPPPVGESSIKKLPFGTPKLDSTPPPAPQSKPPIHSLSSSNLLGTPPPIPKRKPQLPPFAEKKEPDDPPPPPPDDDEKESQQPPLTGIQALQAKLGLSKAKQMPIPNFGAKSLKSSSSHSFRDRPPPEPADDSDLIDIDINTL
ncbi:hypothetical protein BLNAU_13352 [Blattamonas nauphoetae]|uniref:Uncharacterized protein n=1 Tax=Blattamonas nauphoetae TaxID=2049346 RepID=A0ABQ9XJV4_9EUKA|nr:hypothetical protein BLNAU_13352 [Blattamonas nauphoetae]